MFDPQFRLSPDLLNNGTTSDDSSSNGPWPQMSLDRLLEHHDIKPAEPISMNNTTNNDYLSSSAQFKEFFNNYHQQYQQQNQPVDISSLISSSSPQQQQFSLPLVDNYMFEPQPDHAQQPLFVGQYSSDHNQISIRQDPFHHYQQRPQPYTNRGQQAINIPRQQHLQSPPLLQIPNEDHYQQQHQANNASRFKQNPPPAYVACLNHGINYNGVSGPPILLPPSF
jgi:hypothetical protein